jgi:hypothetical protein
MPRIITSSTPPTTTRVGTKITPAPAKAVSTIGAPTGTIPTSLAIAYGRGGPWATVNAYDAAFVRAGTKHGVDPAMLKAMAVIESGGQMIANQGGSGAWGIMQFKRWIWQPRADAFGYDLNTAAGQIGMAAAILGGAVPGVRGTTPEERFLEEYYPVRDASGTLCLDCRGEDGHTPRQYLSDMHELMRIINAAAEGTTPAPAPDPQPAPEPLTEQDVLRLIAGPTAWVSFGFNEANMSCGGPCHFYEYGVGHGTHADHMHPGIDIAVPRGTTLRTPLAGRITCVGNAGEVIWDQGCGYFTDTSGGVGNVTVMTDVGLKLTFGHCAKSLVAYNQRVKAGEAIALSGTNRADHLHLDVVSKRNGQRWLNDPLPTLVAAMRGTPLPISYADPIDIPQPDGFDVWWTVTAKRDGVPVLQRADLESAPTFRPLTKGEEVEVVYFVIGSDGDMYAVTPRKRRIPVSGLDLSSIKEMRQRDAGETSVECPPQRDLTMIRADLDQAVTLLDNVSDALAS